MRYRFGKNDAPVGAADWLPAFVIAESMLDGACGGLCARGEVCVAASQECGWPGNGCPACAEEEACVNGACEAVVALPPPSDTYPEDTGAQARDGAGNPMVAGNTHLCFQDGTTDSLRDLAPELGLDEWVDDGTREDDGRDSAVHIVGEDCNIRLDAGGNPLIVYQDATAQDMVLSRCTWTSRRDRRAATGWRSGRCPA